MVNFQDADLIFFVNGKKVIEKFVNPEWTLLYYLRNKLLLCGTKLGCGEGGCGACTVMISRYDRNLQIVNHYAINACLAPICSMHGLAITTVEGIGSSRSKLHLVQERIAKSHGTQCGFCTPGIVMSMYTLLKTMSKPSMYELETALQGNLCRCTGYRPIVEGFKMFTEDWEVLQSLTTTSENNGVCAMGNNCCKKLQTVCESENETNSKFVPYDETQEPIFPPELKLYDTLDNQNLTFKGSKVTWYRPTSLNTLLYLKEKYPGAKIIGGNTEVGIEVKFKNLIYDVLIQSSSISELTKVEYLNDGIKIGSSCTLYNMEKSLKKQIDIQPDFKSRTYVAINSILKVFASKQIKSVATVGGNIITASPISDLNQIFMATKVQLEFHSKKNGIRMVVMDQDFFLGYRKPKINDDEVLVAINIFHTTRDQYVYAYKQSRRRDDDLAIVNFAANVTFEPSSNIIKDIRLAFGGMATTTVGAPITRAKLLGRKWNAKSLEIAYNSLLEDLPLPPHAPGGMIQYRRSLTLSFFYKAYLSILDQLQWLKSIESISQEDKSAIFPFQNPIAKSSQYYNILKNQDETDTIGQPIIHRSAIKHSTGEAVYCDDIPRFSNELYLAFVLSTRAHAKILSVDTSDALNSNGVHLYLSAENLKSGRNKMGKTEEEVVFVSDMVTAHGQIIGAIIAENQAIAQKAAKLVRVTYENLEPVIISIEDAIKHNSYFGKAKVLEKGDVDSVFRNSPHVVEGVCRNGGQEHFYMETQCTVAVPKNEDGEMELFCSTQYPSVVNKVVSRVLNVSQNKIAVRVKRIGGGFGGKEHQVLFVAVPVALAASCLNRPVRCMLNRDEDIQITGGRHPFLMKYKVAFDDVGKILGCYVCMYANSGYSVDVTPHVLERALLHFENVYNIPSVRAEAYICKTNLPSNMAFRGFGAPQAMLIAEFMVRSIAEYLNKDVLLISRINMYKEGDITPYNQIIERCTIGRCWEECISSSCIVERNKVINKYNRENRWKKRGISLVPTKYGISFHTLSKNQAGALLHIYTDGSVLLSHGGTEMGQGLHTKMIQIASRILKISIDKILISETSTDKVPNTSATAASISSDLNGMAVKNACEIIMERLLPYMKSNPNGKWEDWVSEAYMDRVSLSTTGFYKTPFPTYDWETNSGQAFHYFTYGVACSEVEIDCLTGDHRVLRTDIVMDVGESLNPAIDVGQIEGAFMQGYGFFMLEEMLFSANGAVLTKGPGTYKIPTISDIPVEFNVSLLKGAPNPSAVYSSKAIGEPPLFLASSVLFAVREAIKSARADAGVSNHFDLHAPVTSEKIRMACQDHLTAKLPQFKSENFTSWNVIP